MKKLCEQKDPSCDCYVYTAGKERENCIKTQNEIIQGQVNVGQKDLISTKLDFETNDKKTTITTTESTPTISPWFTLLNPYKQIDITIDCSIKNRNATKIEDNLEKEKYNQRKYC